VLWSGSFVGAGERSESIIGVSIGEGDSVRRSDGVRVGFGRQDRRVALVGRGSFDSPLRP